MIRLSILDQSIVPKGSTASEAIANTIRLVKWAETSGYHRFWVSEHHNSSMIAGSAPELLMVRLAHETSRIRIGSGGIMLPNHSALKVAENFRLLETLYPGRIDLGMGRAPGGDQITALMLNPSNNFQEASYLQQLEHLQAFFHDEAATQYGPLLAVPQTASVPDQWILSSSGGSASIAAKMGMGLAVARFINGFAGREIVEEYKKAFKPSRELESPKTLVAVSVLCADTVEKAAQLRKLADYTLLQFEKGNFREMNRYEDVQDYVFSPAELERIRYNSGRIVSGTPEDVREQLLQLAGDLDTSEIMVTSMTHSQTDRFRSFELLAEVFGISLSSSADTFSNLSVVHS
ncbi:MAG: LLM class flavin-dependent oxidoreductase [Bacteroidota bacterium]|nr:LLM class flavin-dependent oxidoreductase [Bacteroidota bacterium]